MCVLAIASLQVYSSEIILFEDGKSKAGTLLTH